jgi:AcrR family transcriptional regulator
MAILNFKLSEKLFVRDPQETKLGRDIVQKSVKLIDKLGFEEFTFRKLAYEIGSTEASVYRYFDNKHMLLIYLIDWYWTWLEHSIDFQVNNIGEPSARLRACLRVLCDQRLCDKNVAYFDDGALQRIVHAEFEKTYLTKQVDADNKDGLFLPYKSLCDKIAAMVRAVNPRYTFPRALVSTLMLAANHQLFYAAHLPSLTDIRHDPQKQHKKLNLFLETLVFKTIEAS